MKVYQPDSEHLRAIAHPVRVQILWMLRRERQYVCHLITALGVQQPNVSQHLARLRAAGIILSHREGRRISYSLQRKELMKPLSDLCRQLYPDSHACLVYPVAWWLCPCQECSATRIQTGLEVEPLGSYGVVASVRMTDCGHDACVRTCQVTGGQVAFSLGSDCNDIQQWAAELHLADLRPSERGPSLGCEVTESASRHLCNPGCSVPVLVLQAAAVASGTLRPAPSLIRCVAEETRAGKLAPL